MKVNQFQLGFYSVTSWVAEEDFRRPPSQRDFSNFSKTFITGPTAQGHLWCPQLKTRRAVLFRGRMIAKPEVKETNPSGSGSGTIMIPKRISDHPKASQAIFVQIIENNS